MTSLETIALGDLTKNCEIAETEYRQRRAKLKADIEAFDRLNLAISLSRQTINDRNRRLADSVEHELAFVGRNSRRALLQREEMSDAIQESKETVEAYRQRFLELASKRGAEIARELHPRLVAATGEIADAIEALNAALRIEAEVHEEYARRTPTELKFTSLLPQLAERIRRGMMLEQRDSPAATWARAARDARLLQ